MAAGIMLLSQVGSSASCCWRWRVTTACSTTGWSPLLIGIGVISIALTPGWCCGPGAGPLLTDSALLCRGRQFRPRQTSIMSSSPDSGVPGNLRPLSQRLEIPFWRWISIPERVSRPSWRGEQVAFGDASRAISLLAAGLMQARLAIITFDDKAGRRHAKRRSGSWQGISRCLKLRTRGQLPRALQAGRGLPR